MLMYIPADSQSTIMYFLLSKRTVSKETEQQHCNKIRNRPGHLGKVFISQLAADVVLIQPLDNAVDFREIDYTRPTCILMGQEKTGITQEALALADQDIIIPMIGMVQSLNVSVASALILYEAQRQRQNAGMYLRENSMLPEAEQQRLLFEGGYPVLAKVAKRKGLPYPHVNQQGEIEADADWWSTMQAAG